MANSAETSSNGIDDVEYNNMATIRLQGSFTDREGPAIQRQIETNNINNFIIDFSGVTFINSQGIAVVLQLYKKLEKRNKNMVLINLKKQHKKVFHITKISEIINIFNTEEEAINFFEEGIMPLINNTRPKIKNI